MIALAPNSPFGLSASGNSTALTLLKGSAQSAAAATKQSAASQLLSSISGVNLDPLKQAEGQITRILLESGGQFIVGSAFSDITGTDKDDIIRAGPGSGVNGGMAMTSSAAASR